MIIEDVSIGEISWSARGDHGATPGSYSNANLTLVGEAIVISQSRDGKFVVLINPSDLANTIIKSTPKSILTIECGDSYCAITFKSNKEYTTWCGILGTKTNEALLNPARSVRRKRSDFSYVCKK